MTSVWDTNIFASFYNESPFPLSDEITVPPAKNYRVSLLCAQCLDPEVEFLLLCLEIQFIEVEVFVTAVCEPRATKRDKYATGRRIFPKTLPSI